MAVYIDKTNNSYLLILSMQEKETHLHDEIHTHLTYNDSLKATNVYNLRDVCDRVAIYIIRLCIDEL